MGLHAPFRPLAETVAARATGSRSVLPSVCRKSRKGTAVGVGHGSSVGSLSWTICPMSGKAASPFRIATPDHNKKIDVRSRAPRKSTNCLCAGCTALGNDAAYASTGSAPRYSVSTGALAHVGARVIRLCTCCPPRRSKTYSPSYRWCVWPFEDGNSWKRR